MRSVRCVTGGARDRLGWHPARAGRRSSRSGGGSCACRVSHQTVLSASLRGPGASIGQHLPPRTRAGSVKRTSRTREGVSVRWHGCPFGVSMSTCALASRIARTGNPYAGICGSPWHRRRAARRDVFFVQVRTTSDLPDSTGRVSLAAGAMDSETLDCATTLAQSRGPSRAPNECHPGGGGPTCARARGARARHRSRRA